MSELTYFERIQKIKLGLLPKEAVAKPKKPIAKKSKKKIAEEKENFVPGDSFLETWHKNRRKEQTGVCQCGCSRPSQKKDDTFFRGSNCHIFPKNKFESIMYHPLNCVERAMFGGCHSIMDDTSIERWVNMADWDDIKAKFKVLEPLITENERKHKFFTHLKRLVDEN
jgi:hypothetical protein